MTRLVRLFLLILLALLLPTIGLAGGIAPAHCPMQGRMMAMDQAGCHACCGDHGMSQHDGPSCPDCQGCVMGDAVTPPPVGTIGPIAVLPAVYTVATTPFRSHNPIGLWRPPTSL